ncbi:MAG: hypothetical protein K8J08_20570 [Thermoanaerobaculia bacterium]|nr:hypothetical protein [Thermoanaerobaculia bacterium]
MFLTRTIRWSLAVMLLFCSGLVASAESQGPFTMGTEFVYQGNLHQAGSPADGLFDLSFELFDARRDGRSLGQIDLLDVAVEDGVFAVELDFRRSIFAGDSYWIETQVRPAGVGVYNLLAPRDLAVGRGGSNCTVDTDVLISGTLDIEPQLQEPGLEITCCNEASLAGGGQVVLHGDSITDPAALRIDYDEIQSTLLGQPDHLQLNPHGGNIGLGLSDPVHPVHVTGGPDVTPNGGGALVVGISTNIAVDQNEIQAHAAGAPSLLTLNNDGGNVRIGGWLGVGLATNEPIAPLQLPEGPGASGTGGGSLVVGGDTNVAIDQNEIQAHSAGGPAILRINRSGGDVRIGGPTGGLLDIGVELVAASTSTDSVVAECPSGTFLLSGGCNGFTEPLQTSAPVDSSSWLCSWEGDAGGNPFHEAFALCGRLLW